MHTAPPDRPYPKVNGTEPCRRNPELWFDTQSTPKREAAIAACGTCHVLNECAAYALTARAGANPVVGIWGGTTGEQRRLRRVELGLSIEPVPLTPHGSPGAIQRHRRAHEPLCAICEIAEYARDRARGAAS